MRVQQVMSYGCARTCGERQLLKSIVQPAESLESQEAAQRQDELCGGSATPNSVFSRIAQCMQPEEEPLLESIVQPAESREHKRLRTKMSLAMWSSLVANVLLLAAKIVAYVLSHSSAILASAADSFVDIASQASHCSGALPAQRLSAAAIVNAMQGQ